MLFPRSRLQRGGSADGFHRRVESGGEWFRVRADHHSHGSSVALGCAPHVQAWMARPGALVGIPGSFGGAIASNAGAGQSCIGESLVTIDLLTDQGEELTLVEDAIRYEYRSMKIPRKHVITGGTLKLRRGIPESIQAELAAARARRQGKQPWDKPSAGCVFKNPSPSKPAGAIIDGLGLKAPPSAMPRYLKCMQTSSSTEATRPLQMYWN